MQDRGEAAASPGAATGLGALREKLGQTRGSVLQLGRQEAELDDQLEDYTTCPGFLAALAVGMGLEESACFRGQCPSRDDDSVVCPSGFWGFRHEIGVPLSVGEDDDAAVDLGCGADSDPAVGSAVYAEDFVLRQQTGQIGHRIPACHVGDNCWMFKHFSTYILIHSRITKRQERQ